MLFHASIDTPIGPLLLVGDGTGLTEVGLPERGKPARPPADATESKSKLHAAARQFDEYFAGKRLQFELPLRPSGTPFQLEVWGALLTIPYGETVSYADIARRIRKDSPTAQPNRLIVGHADELLARQGRMIEALNLIGPGDMSIEGRPFRIELDSRA